MTNHSIVSWMGRIGVRQRKEYEKGQGEAGRGWYHRFPLINMSLSFTDVSDDSDHFI